MSSVAELPGMVVGVSDGSAARHAFVRGAPNLWWLCVGDIAPVRDAFAAMPTSALPSQALHDVDRAINSASSVGDSATTVVAKLELDVCGAWVTMANAGPARPVVVRRAGWVDVRGHPAASLVGGHPYEPADDRVGLGPGDVLVLRSDGVDPSMSADHDDVLDAALSAAGAQPDVIAGSIGAVANGADPVLALGVPHDLGTDPRQRLMQATGLPLGELQSPGYPLADLQPDLWKAPPRPPRLARLQLTNDQRTVSAVRSLLDRLLASWRLTGRIEDADVKLVATELAANAVVHSDAPRSVTVRYLGDVVRVEVVDLSTKLPQPRVPDAEGVGGRGLQLVEALGSAWGTDTLATGKRVWCELPVAAG